MGYELRGIVFALYICFVQPRATLVYTTAGRDVEIKNKANRNIKQIQQLELYNSHYIYSCFYYSICFVSGEATTSTGIKITN